VSSDRKRNYELLATKIFAKDLEKLNKPTNQRIAKSIDGLRYDPFLGKSLRGELKGLFSLRVVYVSSISEATLSFSSPFLTSLHLGIIKTGIKNGESLTFRG